MPIPKSKAKTTGDGGAMRVLTSVMADGGGWVQLQEMQREIV